VEFFTYLKRAARHALAPSTSRIVWRRRRRHRARARSKTSTAYGIDRIFSPEDGRKLGLQGMINLDGARVRLRHH
jgi:hypothetical protein